MKCISIFQIISIYWNKYWNIIQYFNISIFQEYWIKSQPNSIFQYFNIIELLKILLFRMQLFFPPGSKYSSSHRIVEVGNRNVFFLWELHPQATLLCLSCCGDIGRRTDNWRDWSLKRARLLQIAGKLRRCWWNLWGCSPTLPSAPLSQGRPRPKNSKNWNKFQNQRFCF